MRRRDRQNEIVVALIVVVAMAFALIFGIVLSLGDQNEADTPRPTRETVIAEVASPSPQVEPVGTDSETVEAIEAETIEAETIEAETIEAETIEAETIEAETPSDTPTEPETLSETSEVETVETQTPNDTPTPAEPIPTETISIRSPSETKTQNPIQTETPSPEVDENLSTEGETETPLEETAEPSPTNTLTPTDEPSPTRTPSLTRTPSNTPSPTDTLTPTDEPSPTPTRTASPSPTDTPSNTPSPTDTPSNTPNPTDTPSNTPSPTDSPSPTADINATLSAALTETRIALSDTPSPSPEPSATPEPSPTATLIATQTTVALVIIPSPTLAATIPQTGESCSPAADWLIYIVDIGDSMSRLAQRFNITAAELSAGNCFPPNPRLVAGQPIRVPPGFTEPIEGDFIGCTVESALITSPAPGAILEDAFSIEGLAFGEGFRVYRLGWRADDPAAAYQTFRESFSPRNPEGQLGEFRIGAFPDGAYWFQLEVLRADQTLIGECAIRVFFGDEGE